jgi:thiamine-monophosphate kinase
MEAEFLKWLRARLPAHPALLLGPGDDAAILQLAQDARCVVTTDTLNEGVDFHLDRCDWRLVGRKALAVNLSDLAAMAARPVAALVSLSLPRNHALELAQQLFEGLLPLAADFDVAIAGGDTGTWEGPLAITITAIGQLTEQGPFLRRGARPGDAVLVTGEFGGSILGKHFTFQPRVREALLLNAKYRIHAAADVSDGLSLDLAHVTQESGCGALLDLAAIPVSGDARRLAERPDDEQSALEHALGDGEDFELVLAVPADESVRLLTDQPLDVRLSRIGTFVQEPGLWVADEEGGYRPLMPRGYQH